MAKNEMKQKELQDLVIDAIVKQNARQGILWLAGSHSRQFVAYVGTNRVRISKKVTKKPGKSRTVELETDGQERGEITLQFLNERGRVIGAVGPHTTDLNSALSQIYEHARFRVERSMDVLTDMLEDLDSNLA